MIETEKEVWKDIPGYEGAYQVSNLGNFKALSRTIHLSNGRVIKCKERIKNPSKHSSGYLRINLTDANKEIKSHYAHVLVLTAFKCKRPNKQDADHRNGIRTDNRLKNLRWLGRRENRGKIGPLNNNKKINRYVRSK